MSASEATYAHDERSPSTVVDIPSFIAYLKQERDEIVIPLRDGKNDTGCSKDSEEFQKVQTARSNRLKDHLDMLKTPHVNHKVLTKEAALANTLEIICTAPVFKDTDCRIAAQELQQRYAREYFGAGEAVTLGPSKGEPKCRKYFHNGLTPGKTWRKTETDPASHQAVKAGAHGLTQGGIYGHPLSGAYSVTLRFSKSKLNHDDGTKILYGTRGGRKARDPTSLPAPNRETLSLRASIRTMIPVRVLRFTPAGGKRGQYGPAEGWRYDGLYKVTAVETAANKHGGLFEQFTLERLPLEDNKGWSLADCYRGEKSSEEDARKQTKEELETDKEVADAQAERQFFNITVNQAGGESGHAQSAPSDVPAETTEQESDQGSEEGYEESDSDESADDAGDH
ncbi:hypothetical protein CKM354_001218000 [Cercospora kikuchii]|uniref:YDG domain-containing protein n=1 Tax=Cercospora kikuchii TaxID=84275 RepID=A0A9P3FLH4_9PEZI|nr:uncharacterized protein CKM354_001218000 [Cercospora kikuchii]GIZ49144.1 hypothetical protein CKM354_001218000 [Cercospora kikuchii]